MITDVLNSITQFVTSASLWLQVPLVMLVALPLAAVFAGLLLRAVDGTAHAWTRFWAQTGASGSAEDSDSPGTGK
ncbi:hypothetical protein [Corynebacterium halotolerans]|uniref:Uncharacterized protein n=1 Tax=Corynebacterium halotolerans YIM 70093 = DSM 44683 TaxID=1121362 RepID=M1NP17_9CORY|nr:hypothetical protein [Corynebacterium halotolerans]AGF73093.1 hypothetical protein A605_10465 [Corynebacterium halotolerans YIM 70093 = DSM 44683]